MPGPVDGIEVCVWRGVGVWGWGERLNLISVDCPSLSASGFSVVGSRSAMFGAWLHYPTIVKKKTRFLARTLNLGGSLQFPVLLKTS